MLKIPDLSHGVNHFVVCESAAIGSFFLHSKDRIYGKNKNAHRDRNISNEHIGIPIHYSIYDIYIYIYYMYVNKTVGIHDGSMWFHGLVVINTGWMYLPWMD